MQRAGLGDAGVGVVGDVGRQLDGDKAVAAVAVDEHRTQHVERVGDVVDDHGPVRLSQGASLPCEGGELGVVVGRSGDGALEDGGVGGHPADALRHPPPQVALDKVRTSQVVQPRALAVHVVQEVQPGLGWPRGRGGQGVSPVGGRPDRQAEPTFVVPNMSTRRRTS